MEPTLMTIADKKLVGQKREMSLAQNMTGELWKDFMPRRKSITNSIDNNLYSLQVYPPSYFEQFSLNKPFEKWAAVEVTDFNAVPDAMESFLLKGGLYAVFFYKGASTNAGIFQYIYADWIPRSAYSLDNRPHFEILGEKYRNGDPDSEEEIWIPIKSK